MGRPYGEHLLSEEKKKLAGDNVPLVWWYLSRLYKKNKIRQEEMDEISGYMLWYLCLAAETFDSDRGIKFSTYAMRALKSGYIEYLRKRDIFNSRFIVTDFCMDNEDGKMSNEPEFVEQESRLRYEDISYLFDAVELDALEYQIIFLHYQQRFSYNDIGNMMGLTGERIRQIHTGVIEKIKLYAEENELSVEDFV